MVNADVYPSSLQTFALPTPTSALPPCTSACRASSALSQKVSVRSVRRFCPQGRTLCLAHGLPSGPSVGHPNAAWTYHAPEKA